MEAMRETTIEREASGMGSKSLLKAVLEQAFKDAQAKWAPMSRERTPADGFRAIPKTLGLLSGYARSLIWIRRPP
jgi:hypothetical protein